MGARAFVEARAAMNRQIVAAALVMLLATHTYAIQPRPTQVIREKATPDKLMSVVQTFIKTIDRDVLDFRKAVRKIVYNNTVSDDGKRIYFNENSRLIDDAGANFREWIKPLANSTLTNLLDNVKEASEYSKAEATEQAENFGEAVSGAAKRLANFSSNVAKAMQGGRRLQQDSDLPDPIQRRIDSTSKAFVLLFGNVFDLALLDGIFFALPFLSDIRFAILNWNWIKDFADFLDAPIENILNANYFPLPQDNDGVRTLMLRFISDYCSEESATESTQVLGAFALPTFTAELTPWECPILRENATLSKYVDLDACTPATLTITTTPTTVTDPYFTAASYTGPSCLTEYYIGSDLSISIGGGSNTYTFKRTNQGVDIIPINNAVSLGAYFGPYLPYAYDYEETPALNETSATNLNTPGAGSNEASLTAGTVASDLGIVSADSGKGSNKASKTDSKHAVNTRPAKRKSGRKEKGSSGKEKKP